MGREVSSVTQRICRPHGLTNGLRRGSAMYSCKGCASVVGKDTPEIIKCGNCNGEINTSQSSFPLVDISFFCGISFFYTANLIIVDDGIYIDDNGALACFNQHGVVTDKIPTIHARDDMVQRDVAKENPDPPNPHPPPKIENGEKVARDVPSVNDEPPNPRPPSNKSKGKKVERDVDSEKEDPPTPHPPPRKVKGENAARDVTETEDEIEKAD
jgi:hypothetical protein